MKPDDTTFLAQDLKTQHEPSHNGGVVMTKTYRFVRTIILLSSFMFSLYSCKNGGHEEAISNLSVSDCIEPFAQYDVKNKNIKVLQSSIRSVYLPLTKQSFCVSKTYLGRKPSTLGLTVLGKKIDTKKMFENEQKAHSSKFGKFTQELYQILEPIPLTSAPT